MAGASSARTTGGYLMRGPAPLVALRNRIIRYTQQRAPMQELMVGVENQKSWNIRTPRWFFTVETRYSYTFVQVIDQTTSEIGFSHRPLAFLFDSTDKKSPYEVGATLDALEAFLDKELILDDLAGV